MKIQIKGKLLWIICLLLNFWTFCTTMASEEKYNLIPLQRTRRQIEFRDGRIILGEFEGSNEEKIDRFCTTSQGNKGKCQDLSDCPGLLLDLNKLRKSICFKALFVPGVCCEEPGDTSDLILPPQRITTTRRPTTAKTTRQPTTQATTQRSTTLPPRPKTTTNPVIFEGSATIRPTKPTREIENNLLAVKDCGEIEVATFRIVGGELSRPGQWPWMAAIFLHGPNGVEFWCGGSLISAQYILTAAHCTRDSKQRVFHTRQFSIQLGDVDLTRTDNPGSPETYQVVQIIVHPQFRGHGFYNDISLFKMDRAATLSSYVRPVCLPPLSKRSTTYVGDKPTVLGWGTSSYGGKESGTLQQVELPVWRNDDCDKSYVQPITDIFLCAGYADGGKDACQGDSGGPLVLPESGKWTQIGIVSFGNKCAEPGYPGVYTRITQFLDWIKENAT